jgi:UDP-glucose 4-epimerase
MIGLHLVPLLLGTGRKVTVLGRRAVPPHPLPLGAEYVAGDFGDCALITSLLGRHSEVIHLAYATVPNSSYSDPLGDLQQNLHPSVQLFEEAAKRGCRLLLLSSGGTVYGQAKALPISEDHPTDPISPYGVTKLTLEKYARLYSATHGLQVICVRPANAYGAGQRPFSGQGFVSTALASAISGQAIKVYGPEGTVRDYVFVSDVAAGILKAFEHGAVGEVYNIGTGRGLSNLEMVGLMAPLLRGLGHALRLEHLPARVFDVRANVLDSGKLRKAAGWAPEVAVEEGLARTLDWLRADIHG